MIYGIRSSASVSEREGREGRERERGFGFGDENEAAELNVSHLRLYSREATEKAPHSLKIRISVRHLYFYYDLSLRNCSS